MKRLTLFNTYAEYTAATGNFDLPNVSVCKDVADIAFYMEPCNAADLYEITGEVSYPSEIGGIKASFTMQIPYRHTVVTTACSRTIVDGVDSVIVTCGENPSTTDSRTVSGTYVYHGIEIEYSLTQTKYEHEYVMIGSVKWATMNVGATGITDNGLCFAWGDTQGYTRSQVGSGEGKKYFGWADYKYGNGTSSPGKTGMTKYNGSGGKTTLESSDDAVTVNWGGGWRMPTRAEYVALGNATTSAWTTSYEGSGKAGLVLTSKADTNVKLFFPAAGTCGDGSVYGVGSYCGYWSSSLYTGDVVNGYYQYIDSSYGYWLGYSYRCLGFAVRGVLD